MENKKDTKYVILLVIFTILFFISTAICITGFSSIAKDYKYRSLSGRLESIEREEKMHGPASTIGTMNLDDDYEEEFDTYWEFYDVYREYVKGRFSDDPSSSLTILNEYANSCENDERKETVLEYINTIKESPARR